MNLQTKLSGEFLLQGFLSVDSITICLVPRLTYYVSESGSQITPGGTVFGMVSRNQASDNLVTSVLG